MLKLIISPKILQRLFDDFLWKIETNDKVIYLTFDDGPHHVITPWIIDLMNQYNAKGTFFLIGDAVKRNPELYQLYKTNGHQIGNHTYRHINGLRSRKKNYLEEIAQCAEFVDSSLFRPPYGQINLRSIREIKKNIRLLCGMFYLGTLTMKLLQKFVYPMSSSIQKKVQLLFFMKMKNR